jgi:serine/threonine protein kinase
MQPEFEIVREWHRSLTRVLYIGRSRSDGRLVVVKTVPENATNTTLNSFLNEVRVLSRGHNGLVPVLYSFRASGRPYYVMDMMAASLTRYCGGLSETQTYRVAIAVASALAGMHSSFDIHGDPKPDNILLDSAGHIYVSDPIGNSSPLVSWLRPSFGGTPGYRAPEIRANLPISTRSDVYAFGATLSHMMTGTAPSDGDSIALRIKSCLRDPQLSEIVRRCCQPNPGDRPSMHEVLRMLGGESWADIKRGQAINAVAISVGLSALAWLIVTDQNSGSAA